MTPDTPLTPSRRALRAARETPPESSGFGDVSGLFGAPPPETPTPADPVVTPPADAVTQTLARDDGDASTLQLPLIEGIPAPEELSPETLGWTAPQSAPAEPDPAVPVIAPDAPIGPEDEPGFAEGFAALTLSPLVAPAAPPVDEPDEPLALAWVDAATLPATRTPDDPAAEVTDLLEHRPHKSPLRASVVVPTLIVLAVLGIYTVGTQLWPLYAVAPTVAAAEIAPAAAVAATPAWPADGSAAVAVEGMSGVLNSADSASSIASITKVVTALLVLEEQPLAVGEQGQPFPFTWADSSAYWGYLNRGESALDVPVGGSLTQYQLLQGMLIGSANNYADRLAGNLWPTDAVYAAAANSWLDAHGVDGITIVDPTGIESGNTATPAGLIALAKKALANPVIAEIVKTQSVELPGAGTVENTNALLADAGVVGVKTGTLDAYTLLTAKDITVGETPVRLYASVLGQPSDDARNDASRALFAQLETELQPVPSVTTDTTAGYVETVWGEKVPVVTASDATVVLWNGGSGTVTTAFDLEADDETTGDAVGTLTVEGPIDTATVELRLAGDVEPPSFWWRLTHPLQLLGLVD